MKLDLKKWAVVGLHDDTGVGRSAQDVKRILGMQHLAVQTDRLTTHPMIVGRDHPLSPDMSEPDLLELLSQFNGILALERWNWHPRIFHTAKKLGVRIVTYVNWEWFRGTDPEWKLCDLFVCPSPFTVKVVKSYGFNQAIHVPWALDVHRFSFRAVSGPARLFIHNAGIIDDDDRKGTRDTIRAFTRTSRDDIRLLLRMQKPAELPPLDSRVEVRVGNLPDPAALYTEGDVAIQPSKMEGCGLNVLEPVCVGMPVITTDYPPMSDHVRQPEMRVRKNWFKRDAFPRRAAAIPHAHLRLPSIRDLTRKIEWCAANDMSEISRQNRKLGVDTYGPESLREQWSRALTIA